MNLKTTFFTFILFIPGLVLGNTLSWDSIRAKQYFDQADDLYNSGQFDQSSQLYLKASRIYDQTGQIEKYLDCLTESCRNIISLGHHDSSIWLMNKVIAIASRNFGSKHPAISIAYNRLAFAYTDLGDLHKALQYDEANLELVLNLYGHSHIHTIKAYYNLAHSYQFLNRFNECLDNCEKAIDAIELLNPENKNFLLSYVFLLMGKSYSDIWDYDQALNYSLKSHELTEEIFGDISIAAAKSYGDISANIYEDMGQYDKALQFQLKGLSILEQIFPTDLQTKANGYINLGKLYYKHYNLYDSAIYFLKKGLNIFQKDYPGHYHNVIAMLDLALTFEKKGDALQALKQFQRAEKYYQDHLTPDPDHTANLYKLFGNHFYNKASFQQALEYYQKGIDALAKNVIPSNSLYEPVVLSEYIQLQELIGLLQNKARTFHIMYKNNPKVKYLEAAQANYRGAVHGLDSIRIHLQENWSKQYLMDYHYDIYEGWIETSIALYQHHQNKDYLEEAFQAAEQSRARLLLENLMADNMTKFAGVPADLLTLERNLKSDINLYQGMLLDHQVSEEKENDQIKLWKNKLFALRRRQDSLNAALKQQYSKYYAFKYELQIPSVAEIQQTLSAESCLVEFFTTDSLIYSFLISPSNFNVNVHATRQSIDSLVAKYRHEIARGRIAQNSQDFTRFSHLSYVLYQELFESVEKSLPPGTEKLIISPHGLASLLPFELLISHPGSEEQGFGQLDYLIKQYQISYTPSASILLQELPESPTWEQQFAGYAPSYNPTFLASTREINPEYSDQITQLKHTTDEVISAGKLFKGTHYVGDEATEEAFKTAGNKSRILHLALHALVDDQNPLRSKLIFSQNARINEDGYLNAYELYNMQLNNELVVLSACNTGYGKLHKGEGVMSLSRAFNYAGSRSLIMSLWAVNDHSTAEIMNYFYQELASGRSKDEALRQAKITYLEKADLLMSHPYYWGAFIASGNMDPLIQQEEYSMISLLMIIALTLFTIIFIYLKWRKQSSGEVVNSP
ncbi:MAG: CHAT domain-containing protein [Candidatus Cyclobacteriaceae bacterium M3_2C_046]